MYRSYRVGAPGFLISKEMMDSGIKGNRGLRDQRLALIWLRHHIEGFNGDPDNMTVVGQSAGAGKFDPVRSLHQSEILTRS